MFLEKYDEAVSDYSNLTKLDPNNSDFTRGLKEAQLEVKKAKRVNHYKVLSLEKDADAEAIKKAYKKSALKWHPVRARLFPYFSSIFYHVLFRTSGEMLVRKKRKLQKQNSKKSTKPFQFLAIPKRKWHTIVEMISQSLTCTVNINTQNKFLSISS